MAKLPTNYLELGYIQSTGDQWIDTGFKPNHNTRVKMECNVIGFNSKNMFLFGARIASGNTAFGIAADDDNTQWWTFFGNGQENPHSTCIGKHTIDFNKNTLSLDGNVFLFDSTSFQSTYNLLLFASITNGNVDSQRGQMAVHSCQIYDNGTLVRDFLPCVNPSGAVGLYDTVGGQFYGNAGTGVFLIGPPKVTLPRDYTQLEYIQSSGTQWIDTGFTPDQDTRIVYDCERLSAVSAEHFFGVRTGNAAKEAFCFYIYNSGWRYAYNNNLAADNSPSSGRYTFDANKNVMTINGSLTLKNTYAKFKASATATLFSMRSVNSGISYGSHKLFSCQIYDNGNLVRDFIPCIDPTGVVGLYDLVGGKFYGNAGTGVFLAGSKVFWQPANVTDVAIVQRAEETAVITWSAVSNALGYYVYVNGELVAQIQATTSMLSTQLFGYYEIGISAYNAVGEGNVTTGTTTVLPSNPFKYLVYDRTQVDADRMKQLINIGYQNLTQDQLTEWDSLVSKGSWNSPDINRVSYTIMCLCEILQAANLSTAAVISVPYNWTTLSDLRLHAVEQLQRNIRLLQQIFETNPSIVVMIPGPNWKYTQANQLEKNLHLLYEAIKSYYIWPNAYDGTCGGDYL